MADLFSLVGKISVEYSDAMSKIDKVSTSADKAAKGLGKVGKSADGAKNPIDGAGEAAGRADGKFSVWKATMANLASAGIQKVIGGVVSLGKKLGQLTAQSVAAYGDYEQLVGGVETLFKESSDEMLKYADNAYKTAGLSKNAYMETATSFAASLIQGLGGDTAAAVKLADQAIVDMSDNANKMGTDIGMIQNAYQGFAKGNYTMLDNLKLGYGGTQSEMIRLINDSGILQEKIENLDGITFDQVVEAIHKVQTNMGITGTTAKEAASTIQGSIGMMKGAWENFMIAMADPNQDIDTAMNNLVDSVVTVADNLVPRIVAILPRLVEGVTHLCQTLAGYLPGIIEQLFPALVSGILALISKITEILPTVIQLLLSFLPVFIDGVMQLTMGIIEVLPEVIQMVVDALIECLPQLIQGLVQLTIALVAALPEIIMVLINAIPQIIGAIIEGFAPLAGKMKEVAVKVMTGVKDVFTKIWNAIKSTMTNVLNAMKSTVSNIFNSIKSSISNAMNAVKSTVSSILDAVKSKFSSIFNGIKSFLSPVVDWLKNIFHFHWELPKIKLPHFSISGKFSLNPPSIPHFNVSWYKKAMEDGMIMNQPTVFGFNARNNSLMAGGEAGSETVVGTNSLMTMIKTAVATENQELLARVDRLIAILMQFFPQILGGLDRDIILDSGVLVGSLAPGMDTELGSIYKKRKRGVLG